MFHLLVLLREVITNISETVTTISFLLLKRNITPTSYPLPQTIPGACGKLWTICYIVSLHHPYLPSVQPLHLLTALLLSSLTKYLNFIYVWLHHLPLHPHTHLLHTVSSRFLYFPTCFLIWKILLGCLNKQSDSDPIPTCLLKQCASILVPTVTNIVNLSLSSG